jgi:FkbM family methyltransferase
MKALQAGLLALYRAAAAIGALDRSWGRALFETAYRVYKRHYEAGDIGLLQNWVRPNTAVIDVGANVGFFTLEFASWVTEGGRVFALEPEPLNHARLQRSVALSRFKTIIETLQVAAADVTGEGRLELNPLHPGDHKLGKTGIPVATTTIDHMLAARGWPEISLIKIDVQGAEARVLAGARETIKRFWPALFVEVDDKQLECYGSSAAELLGHRTAEGYTIHKLAKASVSAPLSVNEALSEAQARGYADLLFLPPCLAANDRKVLS